MTVLIDRRTASAVAVKTEPLRTLPECAMCPGLCCRNDAIQLYPEKGDDPSLYETVEFFDPVAGEAALILRHKPNGDCIYLAEVGGAGRCSIYDHRPAICRAFDCGLAFAKLSRVDRRALLKADLASREVFDQGRRVQERRQREAREATQETREGPRTSEDSRKGLTGVSGQKNGLSVDLSLFDKWN
jgi:Fe-S-cluster containining protein